ncbi:hypothetical protein LV84_02789 [Algoriphagus ratkowskyi]|uniref:Uncharacterized protein n=1 Tax=Algoriphagus ratkowskyi TaxID=57028 RepID=A0A2W7R653_9BACT|nr:hypothetical protein [Algoriphagus ratkowskyi]PZX54636.1 hypothetical protein LV84_02789 [Algoriphagus ratkowskyi]TXD76946.1 hypothetical protein ESW18_14155 [Algoriphagus ratkowskyi]
MTEEHITKHSRHPFRKKVLRWVMFTFLALLFLEFVVYFGSNLLLSNWARRKINEAAKDVYLVDFNRVRFSLFRRGLFMDGIVMKPIGERRPDQTQAIFDLSLDQLALKNLWYDFSEEILYVGRLEFDNPNISMDLPSKELLEVDSTRESTGSPVKSLEDELKKIIDKINFTGVYIRELEINHADLFFLNFLSQNSLKAENTRLLVEDINWTTRDVWATPFNARGFEFDLENVNFPLPDGVHSIQAEKVYVSSLDNVINITDFRLNSDKSVDSKAYYEVRLSALRVGNVDLNKAFMTSNVLIDEIILNNPQIKVEDNSYSEKDSTATGNLNELIKGVLKSFEVQELSVNNGKFTTYSIADTLKNRIDIKKLDFKMINFYLGDDESRKTNQFFYGEEAAMDIENADLYLSDNVHVIYGDRMSVSSFKDEIIIENVHVEPKEDALAKGLANQIMRISLPKLTLSKANLKRLYNEGVFKIDEMLVQSPKVEITEISQSDKSKASIPVKELLEGYMNELSIGRMDLRDGEVQFKNEKGLRSDDIGFEKFSLLLEEVFLQPNSTKDVKNQFLAEGMVLSLDKYRLKLRDNLHEFLADRVLIDSKQSLVVINNFTLRPENPDSTQAILDTYGRSVILDISIPEFRVEGIDLMSAYLDEKLIIRQILVPSPIANLTRFRKKSSGNSTVQVESTDEIEDLLTSYFSSIQIDSISFSNGQVQYENFAGKKNLSLSEDSLSLSLKGFYLEKGQLKSPERTFFSDEIDLILRKYDFSVAGGNYDVDTDGLRFNSRSKTIEIDNLTLSPSKSIKSKIALSLNLPSVSLEGVDIESFLFENILNLDKLAVDGSGITLEVKRDFQKEDSKEKFSQGVGTTLPKSIEKVTIGDIEATNSKLSINYRVGEDDFESIQTDFDLEIKGLNLDSTANAQKDIAGLFDAINLTLNDFSYTLPDSIHTIKFSNLYVDNSSSETIFSNFEIVPSTITGNPGSPILSAKIDELGVKNNSISEIQSTGVFDLTQLRLLNPKIMVYLDTANKVRKPKLKPDSVSAVNGGLIEAILLQDVLIKNGKIVLNNKETGQIPRMAFNNVNLGLQDLNLDLMRKGSDVSPQLLLEKDLSLSLTNYQVYTKDSLNKLKIGKIKYLNNSIILDSVFFNPTMGRYEFLRKKGFQDNTMDAFVSKIHLEDIDFEEYFRTNILKAHALRVDGLELDVFRDKRIPFKEGIVKQMPQYLMENAPFDLDVDSVIVRNGLVRYEEFAPKAMLPGSIHFEDVDASIAPFVLRKSSEEFPLKSSVLFATAQLMGDGDVTIKADMSFGAPYPMEVEVELGEFDLTKLNNMISRGTFIGIVDGKVTDGKWNFKIDDAVAKGKMNFRYENLHIEFLDSLTLERGRGKLGLMTFLANTITKKSNPRKLFNNRVTSRVYFERDKTKFIFGGWWRATFSGLKGAVGLGQAKAPKRKDEEE